MGKLINHRVIRIVSLFLVVMMLLASCGGDNSSTGNTGGDTGGSNSTGNKGGSDSKGGDDSVRYGGGTPSEINSDSIFNDDGTVTFAPGRVDIDKISTGNKTVKEELVIRLDEENGNLYNVSGGYHPQTQLIWSMTGTCLLTEGYTETGGVDFGVNKYSLIEDYKYDDDYLGITLTIREGAKFHNGDPVLASDIVFSCNQYRENSRQAFVNFDGITAIDDRTVYIPLNWADAGFFGWIGRGVRVFQEKEFRKHEAAGTLETEFYYGNDGTCGMYKITEWVSGDYIKFEKDENFYVPVNIDRVTIRFIADNTVAMMELETGGVDILYSPASTDISKVLAGEYGTAVSGLEDISDMMMMLGFNMTGPLADINLRYALCHAINWKQIVDVAWGPLGAYPQTILARTFEYQKDISDWWSGWYNPAKAEEYMAKTDYAGGGLELKVIINNEATKTIAAELMNKDLAPLGISLKIESYDTATWDAAMRVPDGWDLWIRDWGGTGGGWGSYFNDQGSFTACLHPQYEFPEIAEKMWDLGTRMQQALDPAVAKPLADEIQDMYLNGEIFFMFPMVSTKHIVLYNSKLHNWSRSTNNWYIADAYFSD
jgi:peptide/nickel transport system substrate-binding protein